jgi:DNA-binding NarL/FixJ family response regulator
MKSHAWRKPEHLQVRQKEVWSLLAQGYNNRAIAQLLCMEFRTVQNICHHVYEWLDICDRTDISKRVWAALEYQRSQGDYNHQT